MFAASRTAWRQIIPVAGGTAAAAATYLTTTVDRQVVVPRVTQSALNNASRLLTTQQRAPTGKNVLVATPSAAKTAFSSSSLPHYAWVRRPFASSSSSTQPSNNGGAGGFMAWYEGHLQTRPIVTKMCTGSILWGIGDAVAQIVPYLGSSAERPAYDWPRTGRAVFFGFAIHAPASHAHFNFLEWMTTRAGLQGLNITIFKTFMEQFVYWSWVSNSMYHGAMGAMQGQSLDQIVQRIKDVLWETQKAQWVFWIPIQLINFRLVPVRHQLNVVLLTSIVWTALLSAWYPPEPVPNTSSTTEADEEASSHASMKRRMSLITQQSGGGPADTSFPK